MVARPWSCHHRNIQGLATIATYTVQADDEEYGGLGQGLATIATYTVQADDEEYGGLGGKHCQDHE